MKHHGKGQTVALLAGVLTDGERRGAGTGLAKTADSAKMPRSKRIRQMAEVSIVHKAVQMLLRAAPGAKVILFGSHARGTPDRQSDLDFLVVEPEVKDRHSETVRLREVLRPLRVPVDLLVVSAKVFEEWRDTPNTVIHEAASEGKVYDQVP